MPEYRRNDAGDKADPFGSLRHRRQRRKCVTGCTHVVDPGMEMFRNEHAVESGLLGKHGVIYEDLRLKLLVAAKVVKFNVGHSRLIIAYGDPRQDLLRPPVERSFTVPATPQDVPCAACQAPQPASQVASIIDVLIRLRRKTLLGSPNFRWTLGEFGPANSFQ